MKLRIHERAKLLAALRSANRLIREHSLAILMKHEVKKETRSEHA